MKRINLSNLIDQIDMNRIPKHIAIIREGNGRWAKKRFLPRTAGHREGVERVSEIVEAASNLNIECLSLYAFSTENWKRPSEEVEALMNLLILYIKRELDRLHKNNIRLQTMGDIYKLPTKVVDQVEIALEKTKDNTGMVLNIGLNYGGRDEIVRAVKNILADVKKGKLKEEDINPNIFSKYLYTSELPDPDLLIRTSGELRLSYFMLYQVAYTEFWFSEIYWPDFKPEHLYKAIIDYQQRDRRFGGI